MKNQAGSECICSFKKNFSLKNKRKKETKSEVRAMQRSHAFHECTESLPNDSSVTCYDPVAVILTDIHAS